MNQWNNPFQIHNSLIVLASGISADDAITKDLNRPKAVGKSNH